MDFEKLDVWKRSARLSVSLYRQLSGSRELGFKDQITRSGLSIPSNIAEGMTREGKRDKVRFLLIAKASCAEPSCISVVRSGLSRMGSPGEAFRKPVKSQPCYPA